MEKRVMAWRTESHSCLPSMSSCPFWMKCSDVENISCRVNGLNIRHAATRYRTRAPACQTKTNARKVHSIKSSIKRKQHLNAHRSRNPDQRRDSHARAASRATKIKNGEAPITRSEEVWRHSSLHSNYMFNLSEKKESSIYIYFSRSVMVWFINTSDISSFQRLYLVLFNWQFNHFHCLVNRKFHLLSWLLLCFQIFIIISKALPDLSLVSLTMTLRSWNLRARMSCINISKGVRLNSVGSGLKGCSCTFFSFTPCLRSFISCTHRRAWDANNSKQHTCTRQHNKHTVALSSLSHCVPVRIVSPSLCVSVHPAQM